jgi:hypothetical protein
VNPGPSAKRAASDESHRRGTLLDAVDGVALLPSATKAEGVERTHEKDAALIYTVGRLGLSSALVSDLDEFAARRGWRLAGVHTDADGSAHPSKRRGLAAALVQLRAGVATLLVLDERTYESMPDCLWLKVAVHCAGGVLCVAGDDHASDDKAAVSNVGPVAMFMQMVRPLGLCREAVG